MAQVEQQTHRAPSMWHVTSQPCMFSEAWEMLKTAKLAPAGITILRNSGFRVIDTGWGEKAQLREVSQDPTPGQLYEVQARLRNPRVPLRSVVYRDPGGSPGMEGDLHRYSHLEQITWTRVK